MTTGQNLLVLGLFVGMFTVIYLATQLSEVRRDLASTKRLLRSAEDRIVDLKDQVERATGTRPS